MCRFGFSSFLLVVCTLLGASRRAFADGPWMTEEAIRADFTGETLQGYYQDGHRWVASYAGNGRYELRQGDQHVVGTWHFRGQGFCFLYGPPHWPLAERCGAINKLSTNCYQFHRVFPGTAEGPLREGDFRPVQPWVSRGWRQREPSTCEERPIV